MKIVKDNIKISELKNMEGNPFVDMVKAVVDIEKNVMAVNAELHSDLMEFLIQEENSQPQYLWGINIYPEKSEESFIVFDSMINLKPGLGNRTRNVDDPVIREKIIIIMKKLCQP